MVKRIVIIGPESTGKSTLCKQLAMHFQTSCVEEYAREYLTQNGKHYTYENLLDIAKEQLVREDLTVNNWLLANENKTLHPKSCIFIDTDMYVMKVWCEFVFEKCHHWILNRIAERKYDLYLLCKPDLPWVKDELREYPDLISRQKLFHHYQDILINQPVPWVEIKGNYEERLQGAIKAVDNL